MDKIKVAFVGAGYMAREHIRAFQDISVVKLAGIFSRTKARAQKLADEFAIPLVGSSLESLYKKTHSDLLVISVPELSVREVCLEAFQYPWVCLIEKPAGYNVEDALTILGSAEKNKSTAYVAMNRRHYSSTITLLESLPNVEGRRLLHVLDQENQIAARAAGQPELVIQNWMFANSIHLIDYFNFLSQSKVISVERVVEWNPENPFFVSSKIIYESGDIGLYEAIWNAPGPWAVSLTTEDERWEMRPLEQLSHQPNDSREVKVIEPDEWDHKFKPGLRRQAEEAVKAAMGRGNSLPTLSEFVCSMKLVERIYQ